MTDSQSTTHPPLDILPSFAGSWQIAEWTRDMPRPRQLTITPRDTGRYLLSILEPLELTVELTTETSLRHLEGNTTEAIPQRVCVSFWPGTREDRLIVSLDNARVVIGARRDVLRGVPDWTLNSFLLDRTFRITAEAGAGSPHNPSRDHIHFVAVETHSIDSRYSGLYDIYANDDDTPYDRLLFDPGSGSLSSINGWRSIALGPDLGSGCVFAMFDIARIHDGGGRLMPFETGRYRDLDDDIGVWGAEEG